MNKIMMHIHATLNNHNHLNCPDDKQSQNCINNDSNILVGIRPSTRKERRVMNITTIHARAHVMCVRAGTKSKSDSKVSPRSVGHEAVLVNSIWAEAGVCMCVRYLFIGRTEKYNDGDTTEEFSCIFCLRRIIGIL